MKRLARCPSSCLYLLHAVLAALGALAIMGQAGASQDVGLVLDSPYAYQASNRTLPDVLHGFAADHGLALRIDVKAPSGWQTAKLDGWLRAPTGRAFLEQLAHSHHFSWFLSNRTLYIGSAHDAAVERIALSGMRADDARTALESVGIYDSRFGWGNLSGQDAVLVGGPRAYRALVRAYLAAARKPAGPQAVQEPMIFPLRFAQAGDAAPSAGEPARSGVASLLTQLLAHERRIKQPPLATTPQPDGLPPLPDSTPSLSQWIGYAAPSSAPILSAPHPTPAGGASLSKGVAAGIVADERTNAVIVWADPALRPAIQRLIDALDQPASHFSIDVIVIESNGATVDALSAAGERASAMSPPIPSAFEGRFAEAIADGRIRLLNRQTLVGQLNRRTTLTIGGEAAQGKSPSDDATAARGNGRSDSRGDRLDLTARILPSVKGQPTFIAVDVDLLLAQPTGLPGQTWSNTTSLKLDTAVTLASGAPPRLIASFPVATARAEQRAIFISAKAL